MEQELGSQKTSYEEKLDALEKKLEEATAGDKIAKKDDLERLMADFEERLKNSEGNTVQRYEYMRYRYNLKIFLYKEFI